MQNQKMHLYPVAFDDHFADRDALTFVSPDDVETAQINQDVANEKLKHAARTLTEVKHPDDKIQVMLNIKSDMPSLKLRDFVTEFIGTSNFEGVNYYELADVAEDHFFGKLGSWIKKKAKSVTKVFGKGGVIDKATRKFDKWTGGIASKAFDTVKKAAYTTPIVGKYAKFAVETVGGGFLKMAEKVGGANSVKVSKINETMKKNGLPQNQDRDELIAGSLALSKSQALGGAKIPIEQPDGSFLFSGGVGKPVATNSTRAAAAARQRGLTVVPAPRITNDGTVVSPATSGPLANAQAGDKIFGMDKKTALMVGGAVLVAIYLFTKK